METKAFPLKKSSESDGFKVQFYLKVKELLILTYYCRPEGK